MHQQFSLVLAGLLFYWSLLGSLTHLQPSGALAGGFMVWDDTELVFHFSVFLVPHPQVGLLGLPYIVVSCFQALRVEPGLGNNIVSPLPHSVGQSKSSGLPRKGGELGSVYNSNEQSNKVILQGGRHTGMGEIVANFANSISLLPVFPLCFQLLLHYYFYVSLHHPLSFLFFLWWIGFVF